MAFWISVIGFPAAVWVIGALLRIYRGAPQTCATDVFGLMIMFDGVAMGDPGPFLMYLRPATAAADFFWILFLVAFVCTVVWVICLLDLEPKIIDAYARRTHRSPSFPFRTWGFVWCVCATVLTTHIAIFTGRLPL
jgi:hypothetical protein